MADWETEARPVPAELTPGFAGETYPKPLTRFATVLDQIAGADMVTLKLLSGGIGSPEGS
jgi:hypothetical protein